MALNVAGIGKSFGRITAPDAAEPALFPANNPVLRPPVSGRIGLWSNRQHELLEGLRPPLEIW